MNFKRINCIRSILADPCHGFLDLIDTIDGVKVTKILNEGDVMEIDRGQPHQLFAFDGDVEFVETSTFHKDSDSKRIKR